MSICEGSSSTQYSVGHYDHQIYWDSDDNIENASPVIHAVNDKLHEMWHELFTDPKAASTKAEMIVNIDVRSGEPRGMPLKRRFLGKRPSSREDQMVKKRIKVVITIPEDARVEIIKPGIRQGFGLIHQLTIGNQVSNVGRRTVPACGEHDDSMACEWPAVHYLEFLSADVGHSSKQQNFSYPLLSLLSRTLSRHRTNATAIFRSSL